MPEILPLSAAPHANHQLFSDHYLNRTLPQRLDWVELLDTAAPVRETLVAIFAGFAPSDNEAQTEDGWIKPVLKALGHNFEVQSALKTPDGTKRPDYVFYRTQAALTANKGKTLTEELLKVGGYAVGDAKYWDRPLDVALQSKGKGKDADVFSNKNPGYQIAFYMQHSGMEWGILTNGRLWRLYHRDTAHKLDRYYEVDLPALLQSSDLAAFLYFYAFFRRAAFEPGPLGVSALLHESRDYAQGVGDTLKGQVYEALRHLAQGFLDYAPNNLTNSAETRKLIYDNSLILLYRLLFVLYAEARELLPVSASPAYRDSYSLYALKQSVAVNLDTQKTLLATTAKLWPSLTALFGIIDKGSPPLQVATFNGGLFDPNRHGFLDTKFVGDAHLQAAVDKLSRVSGEFVDYRDLSVRHLGTIYEGLLEYHLDALPAEDKDIQDGWSVALLNDKGERKATGSYYTPDYIVKYIVERAVGPLLDAAIAGTAGDAAQVEAVLQVNVLDPAMGSGHFLVETTEFIARYLINLAIAPGQDGLGEPDLLYWKRRVAQSCVYGVDLNPLAVELAKLSLWLTTVAKDRPLSFLDHHLRAGNALVGARLADLQGGKGKKKLSKKAVLVNDQPVLFNDESLRQNMTSAVTSMVRIETSPAESVADVKRQEQDYRELRTSLSREYSNLAALVTGTHFGIEIDQFYWKPLAAFATGKEQPSLPKFMDWLVDANRLAGEHSFFHWELEFPEVFFDAEGRPLGDEAGFDAVVGNPPYVRQESISSFKPYLKANFASFHSAADLYLYFFEQGARALRQGGRLSFVTSNSWLRANYAGPLRTYLRTEATVETLVDLGDNRVFADAPDVYPIIAILRRSLPPLEYVAQAAVFTRGQGLDNFERVVQSKMIPVVIHNQDDTGWQIGDNVGREVLAKLMAGSKSLREEVGGKLYLGVKTGLNEAFIIDQKTRDKFVAANAANAAVIKPMRQGEDLRPWYQENEGRWVIALPNHWTASIFGLGLSEAQAWKRFGEIYPELAKHLAPFEAAARARTDQGMYWWELRPCDYYPAFDKPKVFWPSIAKFPRFSWDDTGAYVNNSAFIVPVEHPWLLGLLNARAMWFVIKNTCLAFGERAGIERYQLFIQYIARLPVPNASDADKEAIGTLAQEITADAKARYTLHEKVRHRLITDFGSPGASLNQKLTAWWTLDFSGLRRELVKTFNHDIPVKDRDEWQEWFEAQKEAHIGRTDAIVARETDLNARVYALFNLEAAEITLIEAATKYRYGEV